MKWSKAENIKHKLFWVIIMVINSITQQLDLILFLALKSNNNNDKTQ